MIYRPQFAYRQVKGEEDFFASYYLTSISDPGLMGLAIPPGGSTPDIVLRLDPDVPFLLRAIKLYTLFPFSVQLRDWSGKYLTDPGLPEGLTYTPGRAFGTLPGGAPVVFEPEIRFERNGLLLVRLTNDFFPLPLQVAAMFVSLIGTKLLGEASRD